MAQVTLRENENLEGALRRFKKKVDAEGILKTYKDKQYFKKPSVVKREKVKEALRKKKIEELKAERAKTMHKKRKNYKKPDRSYKKSDNSADQRTGSIRDAR